MYLIWLVFLSSHLFLGLIRSIVPIKEIMTLSYVKRFHIVQIRIRSELPPMKVLSHYAQNLHNHNLLIWLAQSNMPCQGWELKGWTLYYLNDVHVLIWN